MPGQNNSTHSPQGRISLAPQIFLQNRSTRTPIPTHSSPQGRWVGIPHARGQLFACRLIAPSCARGWGILGCLHPFWPAFLACRSFIAYFPKLLNSVQLINSLNSGFHPGWVGGFSSGVYTLDRSPPPGSASESMVQFVPRPWPPRGPEGRRRPRLPGGPLL